jgi:hypothetical protein
MKYLAIKQLAVIAVLSFSCSEAPPAYQPSQTGSPAAATGENASGTKTPGTPGSNPTAGTNKPGTPTATTPVPTTPPATTPPAAPPSTPAQPVGVAATGRTTLMQSCVNAGCHSAAGNDFNARNAEQVRMRRAASPAHAGANFNPHFTAPAAGQPANENTHIGAYLATFANNPNAVVVGPTLPAPGN